MTHYRTDLRKQVRSAFAASEYFTWFTQISAWASAVDAKTLPILGIAIPRETKDHDLLDSAERSITIIVVLKRAGQDDVEDQLDHDSAEVEIVTMAAIRNLNFGALLESTEIDISGAGESRIGTLTMMFKAILQTPEPFTL